MKACMVSCFWEWRKEKRERQSERERQRETFYLNDSSKKHYSSWKNPYKIYVSVVRFKFLRTDSLFFYIPKFFSAKSGTSSLFFAFFKFFYIFVF